MNKKIISIEGMSCDHCKKRVGKALNSLQGVSAIVNLQKNSAEVYFSEELSDETLKKSIEDAGYAVKSIDNA